jgi:hypothetical protein
MEMIHRSHHRRETPLSRAVRGIAMSIALSCITAWASDALLVIRGAGQAFDEFVAGLRGELAQECAISEWTVRQGSTVPDLEKRLQSLHPKAVVLLDNNAINLYQRCCAARKDTTLPPAAIVCMGVMVDRAIAQLPNASAIAYEIPPVTSAVNLRTVMGTPINRLGIVYRAGMRNFVERSAVLCRKENIEIEPVEISVRYLGGAAELRSALYTLFSNKHIDALWAPNDIQILRPDLIREAWLPMIDKFKKPVIVGVGPLVDPDMGFGTFSVLPDHTALGAQAADLVRQARDNGWKFPAPAVEQPLSVIKTMNLRQYQRWFGARKADLAGVDKTVR